MKRVGKKHQPQSMNTALLYELYLSPKFRYRNQTLKIIRLPVNKSGIIPAIL